TVDPLEQVLAGLDAAFIGSTDLSVDLGRPGQLGDPLVRTRVVEIARAAASLGIALGAFGTSADAVAALTKEHRVGYVLVGSDLQALRSGAAALASAARAAVAPS
ncbi:MAG: hypothetical protein FJ028_08325, partial [Chloroflexi bacterium]|nr:hypothetical protein [Chloroflexota bacterium]